METIGEAEVLAEMRSRVEKSTQREVSRFLGIKEQKVCDILHGRRPLTAAVALSLGFEELPRQFVRKKKRTRP